MATLRTPREMAADTEVLANSFETVAYNLTTFMPVHAGTKDWRIKPPDDQKIWIPIDEELIHAVAKEQFDTKFKAPVEAMNYIYMTYQESEMIADEVTSLLIRTSGGLCRLTEKGEIVPSDGTFVPNVLPVLLNEDPAVKEEVLSTIIEWVDGEEEAISLLRHCATALAPGWSAVKYMLLIGEGRNGKSLFLKMLTAALGEHNISGVSRQVMQGPDPQAASMMNKLANIVFDGKAEYVKDSGNEKSFTAGEFVNVRALYRSAPLKVHTNALFVEALNEEPKSKDKSFALQSRLSRFWFPNTYANDALFEAKMLSDRYVGAFLSLLIDNYVQQGQEAVLLSPTSRAEELQRKHTLMNSIGLQYLQHLLEDPLWVPDNLVGADLDHLVAMFQGWQLSSANESWTKESAKKQLTQMVEWQQSSKREKGSPHPVRYYKVSGYTPLAQELIEEEARVVSE